MENLKFYEFFWNFMNFFEILENSRFWNIFKISTFLVYCMGVTIRRISLVWFKHAVMMWENLCLYLVTCFMLFSIHFVLQKSLTVQLLFIQYIMWFGIYQSFKNDIRLIILNDTVYINWYRLCLIILLINNFTVVWFVQYPSRGVLYFGRLTFADCTVTKNRLKNSNIFMTFNEHIV